jgi:hypothetical protein
MLTCFDCLSRPTAVGEVFCCFNQHTAVSSLPYSVLHLATTTRRDEVTPVGPKRKTAMISSTSLDLPEYRQQAIDACLRQGLSDAYFENFIIRALAYATGLPVAEVRQIPVPEREEQLWHVLDQRPFLLVLDGLERILLAYARMDAAHLPADGLDEQTANDIARFYGLPDNVKETYLEKHRLRQCAAPRAGYFLRRLAQVHASRVHISTRLYPAELQTNTAQPRPGCYPLFLPGLSDDDALALWRAFIGGAQSGTSA